LLCLNRHPYRTGTRAVHHLLIILLYLCPRLRAVTMVTRYQVYGGGARSGDELVVEAVTEGEADPLRLVGAVVGVQALLVQLSALTGGFGRGETAEVRA